MSSPSERKANENPIETSPQPKETKEQIDCVLQNFDVLPSRVDRVIFKYIYIYLIGLFFPAELLTLLSLPSISSRYSVQWILLWSGFAVLPLLNFLSVLWTFHVWRMSTAKTLRYLVEKKHIALLNSNDNQSYLRFLEHYRDALASPKKCFVSGLPMVIFVICDATYLVQYLFSPLHPTIFATILLLGSALLYAFFSLGGLYCLGIVTWAEYISGWYLRKLVRTFTLRIQPFHPDQCGGLRLLGNFYFGLVSPMLIGSGLNIGQTLFILLSPQRIGAAPLPLNAFFPSFTGYCTLSYIPFQYS